MNYMDIIVIAVIAILGIKGYFKGFVKMCLNFLPFFLSLVITHRAYPYLSKILREGPLYEYLKNKVSSSLGIDKVIEGAVAQTQNQIIDSFPLPDFLKNSLYDNNNPVVYDILKAGGIGDYISGYISNLLINVLSMIVVFIAIYILCRLIIGLLNLFANLPVISFFNRFGGMFVGVLQGFVIMWIAGIGLTFFCYNPQMKSLFESIDNSVLAKLLYENNVLLFMILKIFT